MNRSIERGVEERFQAKNDKKNHTFLLKERKLRENGVSISKHTFEWSKKVLDFENGYYSGTLNVMFLWISYFRLLYVSN